MSHSFFFELFQNNIERLPVQLNIYMYMSGAVEEGKGSPATHLYLRLMRSVLIA